MFDEAVCNFSTSSSSLYIYIPPSVPTWFRIPDCVAAWSQLLLLTCNNCQMPKFSMLPSTLTSLGLSAPRGSWTVSEAGTDPSSSNPDYFDWSWLNQFPNLEHVTISTSSLVGTLPNHLSHSKLSYFVLGELPSLNGTISPNFFIQYPQMITIAISGTQLTGTIPYYGLSSLTSMAIVDSKLTHWPALVSNASAGFGPPSQLVNIDLSNNNLVEVPSDWSPLSTLSTLRLLNNPNLSGPLPAVFGVNSSTMTLQASNCSFSGPLPEMPAAWNGYQARFEVENNLLSGTIPSSWTNQTFSGLALTGNSGLNGSLATLDESGSKIVSQFISGADFLSLGGTGFTGPMFNITSMMLLSSLSFPSSNLDFCSVARHAPSNQSVLFPSRYGSLADCDLTSSNASECAWAYPSTCTTSSRISPVASNPMSPPPSPTTAPETPSAPMASPAIPASPSPTTATQPIAPSSCSGDSPGPSFTCSGGKWISPGSVTITTISVPASTTVIVNGNLTTQSIVITSTSSTINVTGCITSQDGSIPTVTLTLTQSDLETIVKNGGSLKSLLLQQSSGCASLSTESLVVDTSAIKSCKTIKTDKIGGAGGLSVTFTVNTSKCNVWWIVLVSVICVVAIIAVVVIAVVYVVLQKQKLREGHMTLEKASKG